MSERTPICSSSRMEQGFDRKSKVLKTLLWDWYWRVSKGRDGISPKSMSRVGCDSTVSDICDSSLRLVYDCISVVFY